MRVRRYQDKDYAMVESWMQSRKQQMARKSWLPKRGFIVDDVATIFLLKPDCKVAILDFFMTNPRATQENRLKACDLLIQAASAEAQKFGAEILIGNSSIPKVMALGLRYGFVSDGKPYYTFRKLIERNQDVRRNSGERTSVSTNGIESIGQ
jgi:hypothetical protein